MNIPFIIHEAPMTVGESRLVESINNKPVAEGILQDGDTINRNRRCYATADLKAQIMCERTKELLRTGNMKGEQGHPMSDKVERQSTIDPAMVVVKYLDIKVEGNLVLGRFTGTNNEAGRDFNEDLLDGELPSFSLRALGALENVGGKNYVKNLKIITWDRVIYPSHKRAYTTGLIKESASMEDNNEIVVKEGYEGRIIPINNPAVISYIQSESANVDLISDVMEFSKRGMTVLENGDVRLFDESGASLIMSPEKYIKDEIMEWAKNQY